nr:PREDICTED: uncharacterized protein LOC108951212 isoform X2 [Musa acuminata subsp. malaccensis]
MASGESQKHLLSLIRNVASEKSQEELRVPDLKKRLLELQNDLNVANADLDGAKRSREMDEQELRGSQVQLSMIGASIQAQEARTSLLQEEILKLRSDLDTLKSEVGFMRDEFVNSMCELNKKISTYRYDKKEDEHELSSLIYKISVNIVELIQFMQHQSPKSKVLLYIVGILQICFSYWM